MNFWATVCKTVRLITVGPIKMKLGLQVGLDPGQIVLDGTQLPLLQSDTAPPIFGPYLLRPNGQMAAWIKMLLGMELGLGPGDFVLDGDPAPPPQRGGARSPPIFVPCLL